MPVSAGNVLWNSEVKHGSQDRCLHGYVVRLCDTVYLYS